MARNELTAGQQLRRIIEKQKNNVFVRTTVLGEVLPLLDTYIHTNDARIAALEGLLTPEQRRELRVQAMALELVRHATVLGHAGAPIPDERRPGGFLPGDEIR